MIERIGSLLDAASNDVSSLSAADKVVLQLKKKVVYNKKQYLMN